MLINTLKNSSRPTGRAAASLANAAWIAAALLGCVCTSASAQPATPFKLVPGTIPQLTPVVAHDARCVAQSDAHGLIAFGHDRTWPEGHISLFKLDPSGQPILPATTWKMPIPEGLVKQKLENYPLSLAFHPTLPRLYVWQEVNAYYTNPPSRETPELFTFDHLLIYDLAKSPPALVTALCRGPDWIYGQQGGAIAIDGAGQFLYVPSLRERTNAGSWRFGRFPLDADGLPKASSEAVSPLPPPEERIKKLEAANTAHTLLPPDLTPIEYVYLFPGGSYGSAISFLPQDKDLVIAGGSLGLICWRPGDPLVVVSGLPIRKHGATLAARHPKLPLVFASKMQGDAIFRTEFVEGYWTRVPRGWSFPESRLTTAPVVLAKSNQVAIGGQQQIYVVSLDDKGEAKPEAIVARAFSPAIKALTYSEKFDRLYVGVDLSR